MNNIRERVKQLLASMGRGAFERDEAISLALLTALGGESIFLLGLPGVGKSMIARRLKMAFKDATSFEYLMSRFSTPDEIFGPVSISKLKDSDTYERVIDGYLPTADVVFLDEIWKAGPAIQNSLLTVLNEKIFRNGKQDLKLPLKAVISASNELPAEGEGLEALWDRFIVRYVVKPIENKTNFLSLVIDQPEECEVPEELQFSADELREIKAEAMNVKVPIEVSELVFSIRKLLIEEKKKQEDNVDVNNCDLVDPPYVSDRRWKKIVGLLRVSAYLNGREAVDLSDCLILNHTLWDKDEQILSVTKLVAQAIADMVKRHNVDIAEELTGKRYTKPLGDPICPDGKNYIFVVGDEEMLISKEAYEHLPTSSNANGMMTDDNQLLIVDFPTSLVVQKTMDGLSINSYSYPLKRGTKVRTGSVTDMLNNVTKRMDNLESIFSGMVEENILLLPYSRYVYMRRAFTDIKDTLRRKGH
ncbi:MAG: AAA family ATPase [Bacteroidales bacterium]|nr:AAA family ATPase [Bacteroidales bacterium]